MLRRSGPSSEDSEREPLISGKLPPSITSEEVDEQHKHRGTSSCREHIRKAGLFAGALFSGCCAVMQTLLNAPLTSKLEKKLKQPTGEFAAGAISYGITTVILLAAISVGQVRRCSAGRARPKFDPSASRAVGRFRSLVYAAGIFGAAHIVLKMIAAPAIGLSESYLWVTVGQQLSSLTLETYGIGSGQPMKVTALRMCCVGFVLIGAVLSVNPTNPKKMDFIEFRMIALAFIGGLCHPMQALLNKLILPAFGKDGFILTLFNFIVGFIPLTFLWFVSALGMGTLQYTGRAFNYVSVLDTLGGISLALFLILNIVVTQFLDVNAFFIATATGKLLLSLLLDAYQFERGMPRVPISLGRLSGVLLALLGTVALAFSDFISEWLNARKKRIPQSPQREDEKHTMKQDEQARLQEEQDYAYGQRRSPRAKTGMPSPPLADLAPPADDVDDGATQRKGLMEQTLKEQQQENQEDQTLDDDDDFAYGNH